MFASICLSFADLSPAGTDGALLNISPVDGSTLSVGLLDTPKLLTADPLIFDIIDVTGDAESALLASSGKSSMRSESMSNDSSIFCPTPDEERVFIAWI